MKVVERIMVRDGIFQTVQHVVFRAAHTLDMLAAAAIVTMMVLTCADIVLRFFRRPITGTYEIVAFLGALAVACAIAHTSAEKGHVAVNLVVRLLPQRVQGLIESVIALLSLLLFALIAWQSVLYGLTSQRAGEVSLTLQIPLYPIIYGVAFGTGAVCLVCLVDLFDALLKLNASPVDTPASSEEETGQRRDA
jgi:TRAP-type C4-dicarboxylate transport system permease small subunit